MSRPASLPASPVRNADVDWSRWPVEAYLAENYRQMHAADRAVIDHHSTYYRRLTPDSIRRSLEFGAGPNLYPLMLAAACSRQIDAVDPSVANVGYLTRQLSEGPDEQWHAFFDRCRERNPALPSTLTEALTRVHVALGDGRSVPEGAYGLASMHFVAETATEDREEFAALCAAYVRTVQPGGHLVAAFMENLGRYRLGGGDEWPGYLVDGEIVEAVFGPLTDDLEVMRIGPDPTLPDYGYTGMVLMTGRRAA